MLQHAAPLIIGIQMADPTPPAPVPQKPLPSWLSPIFFTLLGIGLAIGAYVYVRNWNNPQPNPAPITLEVDASTPPHIGRRILLHATTAGNIVKWKLVSGPVDETKFDLWPQDSLQHDENFTTATIGIYRFWAITVVGGAPEEAELSVNVDAGPSPIPPGPTPPTPTPGPIPAGQTRVLFTVDQNTYNQMTPEQADVLKSPAFLGGVIGNGKWRVYSTQQTFGDELPAWKDIYSKRKNPIGMVIWNGQDNSVVYEGPIPATVADATALIKKYSGG